MDMKKARRSSVNIITCSFHGHGEGQEELREHDKPVVLGIKDGRNVLSDNIKILPEKDEFITKYKRSRRFKMAEVLSVTTSRFFLKQIKFFLNSSINAVEGFRWSQYFLSQHQDSS